jgi:hypothetical protein
MKDIFVAAYGIEGLSNGLPYGQLDGACALMPETVILAKNIKSSFSGRSKVKNEKADSLLTSTQASLNIGPFSLGGANASAKASHTMSQDGK